MAAEKFSMARCEGNLCIADSWPGQMRTVYGDHERFVQTYFTTYKGKYFTGDGARRDEDGYYWITGRVDDVINVSGHRLGTAEIESAINEHAAVAESAVVGFPHDIKGQGIYAYVTLNANETESPEVRADLVKWVRHEIGPIATPDVIHFSPGLPKTRSGKIMRRILRKIAEGDTSNLGDISTLADAGGGDRGGRPRADPARFEDAGCRGLFGRGSAPRGKAGRADPRRVERGRGAGGARGGALRRGGFHRQGCRPPFHRGCHSRRTVGQADGVPEG
jgi:hypothetical protein